jgi:SAM-dependent methyltransferase
VTLVVPRADAPICLTDAVHEGAGSRSRTRRRPMRFLDLLRSSPTNADLYAGDDGVASVAADDHLLAPERAILARLGGWLEGRSMLDVGVGVGRTTAHFAPIVGSYVGIDLSEAMVRACWQRHGRLWENVTLAVCDARNLTGFEEASFDFVLFSWNGLDCIESREERIAAIRELRRVCSETGYVCVSSHNLGFLPHLFRLRDYERDDLSALLRGLAWQVLLRAFNGSPRRMTSRAGAIVRDGTLDFRLRLHYTRPTEQLAELSDCGFETLEIYGMDGKRVAQHDVDANEDLSLHYLVARTAS